MKFYKAAGAALMAAAIGFSAMCTAFADGVPDSAFSAYAQSDGLADNAIIEGISAESAIVTETDTGTVLAECNSDEPRNISHLAKLMTLLIAAEKIESGELAFDDTVSVSAKANSMGAPQIWLNVGEKIPVEELVKSITIGNANDACVALAEKIGGSEEEFVSLMNTEAQKLGMGNTHFADCTGISSETVSTSRDLAVLSQKLLEFDCLKEYFTTWMDNVRNQTTELVSTNRLIRTYKGIRGLKSCSSAEAGECLIAAAERNGMSVCVVLLGCKSDDDKFSEAKKAMDAAFGTFEIYFPEVDEKAYEKIRITGGEKKNASVKLSGLHNVVIRKGDYPSITCELSREESLNAPAEENQQLGKLVFILNGETILECSIVCAEKVNKIEFPFALKKILLNLLNM